MLNVFTEVDKKMKEKELEKKNQDRILHGVVRGIFDKIKPTSEEY